jgi:serine protease Do
MRKTLLLSTVFLFFNCLSFGADFMRQNVVAEIVEKTVNSVVHVSTKTNVPVYSRSRGGYGGIMEFFFRIPNNVIPQEGAGSGFIYDASGLILTNHHVVDGADEITVDLADGRVFQAVYKGGDPSKDLAILQIKDKNFSGKLDSSYVAKLGVSSALRVGEWVVAIGSPFKLDHSVTVGIVSAKGRSLAIEGNVSYDNLIQTDASINPGNSGGPLLNMAGEVIGINTAINPMGQGLGFAIPINLANRVTLDIARYGEVKRSWLGVWIEDVTPENFHYLGLENPRGVVIRRIGNGTPAQKVGLLPGDIIVRINGSLVRNSRILVEKIQEVPIGSSASLEVRRDGKTLNFDVELTERQEEQQSTLPRVVGSDLGMMARNLSSEDRKKLGLHEDTGGIVISAITRGGFAHKSGLMRGDVIIQVNQQKVESLNDLEKALSHTDRSVLFVIIRNGRLLYLESSW